MATTIGTACYRFGQLVPLFIQKESATLAKLIGYGVWIKELNYGGAAVEALIRKSCTLFKNGKSASNLENTAEAAGAALASRGTKFTVMKNSDLEPMKSDRFDVLQTLAWVYGGVVDTAEFVVEGTKIGVALVTAAVPRTIQYVEMAAPYASCAFLETMKKYSPHVLFVGMSISTAKDGAGCYGSYFDKNWKAERGGTVEHLIKLVKDVALVTFAVMAIVFGKALAPWIACTLLTIATVSTAVGFFHKNW